MAPSVDQPAAGAAELAEAELSKVIMIKPRKWNFISKKFCRLKYYLSSFSKCFSQMGVQERMAGA
jgi:hypothetical protein